MAKIKHGFAMKGNVHPLHNTWVRMRTRCNNKNSPDYARYGGRGIKVCKRWDDFRNFLKDMGGTPKGKSLDRINNDGNYEPENCRWATPTEQANNRSNSKTFCFNGEGGSLSFWGKKLNIASDTLKRRLLLGWSVEKTLSTPLMNKPKSPVRKKTWFDEAMLRMAKEPQKRYSLGEPVVYISHNKREEALKHRRCKKEWCSLCFIKNNLKNKK